MKIVRQILFATVVILAGLALPGQAETTMTPVITGLDEPWGLDHLPDGSVLITEKEGRVLLWRDGVTTEVSGAPRVSESGQGGAARCHCRP